MRLNRDGFTMLEMVVVIAIIIVMVGVAIPLLDDHSGGYSNHEQMDELVRFRDAAVIAGRARALSRHELARPREVFFSFSNPNVNPSVSLIHPNIFTGNGYGHSFVGYYWENKVVSNFDAANQGEASYLDMNGNPLNFPADGFPVGALEEKTKTTKNKIFALMEEAEDPMNQLYSMGKNGKKEGSTPGPKDDQTIPVHLHEVFKEYTKGEALKMEAAIQAFIRENGNHAVVSFIQNKATEKIAYMQFKQLLVNQGYINATVAPECETHFAKSVFYNGVGAGDEACASSIWTSAGDGASATGISGWSFDGRSAGKYNYHRIIFVPESAPTLEMVPGAQGTDSPTLPSGPSLPGGG